MGVIGKDDINFQFTVQLVPPERLRFGALRRCSALSRGCSINALGGGVFGRDGAGVEGADGGEVRDSMLSVELDHGCGVAPSLDGVLEDSSRPPD